jgi:membrane protein YqaA with SNARE-associated domain
VQTLPSVLPQSSGIYLHHTTVIKGQNVFALIIIQAFGLGILVGPVAGYFIDRATAEQCRTHDWPKEHDTLHRNWCITNGYDI